MRASNRGTRHVLAPAVVMVALLWASSIQFIFAAAYNECRVPPQIGASVVPNVMLIMDFSGSMQQPAYYDHSDWSWTYEDSLVFNDYLNSSSIVGGRYDRAKTYYGLFQSGEYYKYDFANGWFYSIVDPSDGSANSADNLGNWSVGVRGNVLNWSFTSRMDSAMKALIGGKAYDASGGDCDSGDSECYLKSEGSRRRVTGSSATSASGTLVLDTVNIIDADLYIRPADKWTTTYAEMPSGDGGRWSNLPNGTGPWPNSYAEPNNSYPLKDLWVSIKANYRGYLNSGDPEAYSKYYELWTFTLDKRTRVELSLNVPGTWSGDKGLLAIINTSNVNDSSYTRYYGDPATASVELAAGTYYVRVAPAETHSPYFTGEYTLTSNVHLTPMGDAGKNGATGPFLTHTIGALPYAAVRVKIAPAQRRGSIHDMWSKARWGFMYYKGVSGHEGKILVRCGQVTTVDQFARYLEGKEDTTNHQPYPYSGTPTGEALAQAYYYFKQSNSGPTPAISHWPANLNGLSPDGLDPFRTSELIDGEYKAVTCRKNYIILMSDGNWCRGAGGCTVDWRGNVSVVGLDPIKPAHVLHSTDIRTGADFPGKQSADVFTVFAFNASGNDDYTWGSRAQKWVAAYGGHRDLPTCPELNGWPFNKTDYISASTESNFTISTCADASPNGCCKEWDLNYDPLYPGGPTGKGVPDNYFEVQSGDQLEQAITAILGKVEQQNASSSAVATVAQQTGEGDIIVRGMFEAKPPDSETGFVGRYLWWGHLESFWPDSDGQYDFELTQYADMVMCKKMKAAGATHCWDAAMPSSLTGGQWSQPPTSVSTPDGTGRHIFTANKTGERDSNGFLVKEWFDTTNADLLPADLGLTGSSCSTSGSDCYNIMKWVLGVEHTTLRKRVDRLNNHWVLGDLVYSTPVVVGPPSLGAVSDAAKALINSVEVGIVAPPGNPPDTSKRYFLNWRQTDALGRSSTSQCVSLADTKKSIKFRDKVVYVGGNDGMVHAFLLQVYDYKNKRWARHPTDYDSNTCSVDSQRIQKIGKEIWSFIPSNFLTELKSLASDTYAQESGGCPHRFMVDLAPRGWEVFFDDEASDTTKVPWHTVLVGGQRGGGDMYFALDVTNPWDPKVLWEYSVLKDMSTRFHAADAAQALKDACAAGTTINPGTLPSTCQAPVPLSSWWPSCSSWTLEQCTNNMNTQFGENTFWMPFSESAYATLKKLPMSWSTPYLGRVKLPTELGTCPSGCTVCFSGTTCPNGWTDAGSCTGGRKCTPTCMSGWTTTAGVHNLVFIGGGIRTFDPELNIFDTFNATSQDFYKKGFGRALWEPFMLALDIRTGKNAFRYVWPELIKQSTAFFPEVTRNRDCTGDGCTLRVPYAMSDPVVLDLWSDATLVPDPDGYDDSIYVADMNGVVYGIKFNLASSDPASAGLYVDLWKVKPIPVVGSSGQDRESNWYRSSFQPLTVQPALALEPRDAGSNEQWLRLVIGGGKHDDIDDSKNDSTDKANMSLYNLREKVDFGSLGGPSWTLGDTVKGGSIPNTASDFRVRANCTSTVYRCTGENPAACPWTAYAKNPETEKYDVPVTVNGCRWYNPDSTATDKSDCCENNCQATSPQPCWKCVFDLPGYVDTLGSRIYGEKVIGKPLIAGGIVFVTTFVPVTKDPCKAQGYGFLYVFDYMCRPFPPGFRPISDSSGHEVLGFTGLAGQDVYSGARGNIGPGIPSQPVLDSSGKFVIVQTSNAELFRISVGLEERMQQIKGWIEKEQ